MVGTGNLASASNPVKIGNTAPEREQDDMRARDQACVTLDTTTWFCGY